MSNFSCNRCILTEGGMDKNHPEQNLQDKRLPDNYFGQKPQRTIERKFVQGALVRFFFTWPTKNGGSEMCGVLLGVPGCVTKCDRGGKYWPKIV